MCPLLTTKCTENLRILMNLGTPGWPHLFYCLIRVCRHRDSAPLVWPRRRKGHPHQFQAWLSPRPREGARGRGRPVSPALPGSAWPSRADSFMVFFPEKSLQGLLYLVHWSVQKSKADFMRAPYKWPPNSPGSFPLVHRASPYPGSDTEQSEQREAVTSPMRCSKAVVSRVVT